MSIPTRVGCPNDIAEIERFLSLSGFFISDSQFFPKMNPAFSVPLPRAWAEIDLPAFERNVVKIKASLPAHVRYISVVKADGYGHGVAHIVERLLQCGIDIFAVSNAREGSDVRYIAPQAEISILGPTLPEEIPQALADDLTIAVSDTDEVRTLARIAGTLKRRARVNIAVDTGMGRMGIWHEQAESVFSAVADAPELDWRGVFTHFSSADSSPEYTALQRSRFLAAIGKIPQARREGLTIHADNSAGLETFSRERPFNAVRVGILQYGWKPAPGSLFEKISPEPVLSFRTRVGLVKNLPAGTPVSYNRTFTLKKDSRIAVLTAGYGDGIPTACAWFRDQGITFEVVLDEGGAVVEDVFPGVKGESAMIGICEKGYMDVELSMNSNGGHASTPPEHTIVGELARAVTTIEKHPFRGRKSKSVEMLFDELGRYADFGMKIIFSNMWLFRPFISIISPKLGGEINALMRTTCAVTCMEGSKAYNVLPPKAVIGMKLRLMQGDTVESALAYLKKIVNMNNF